jgi:hypothetical protein
MEITEVIKQSIKHPNDGTLNSLPEYVQGLIYSVSTYCIDNNKGKVEKAHKINKLIIPIIRNRLHDRKKKNMINIKVPKIKPVENILIKDPIIPPETPLETSREPSPETPPEISRETPRKTPPETSRETLLETPPEISRETLLETPRKTPPEIREVPLETPGETVTEPLTEISEVAPSPSLEIPTSPPLQPVVESSPDRVIKSYVTEDSSEEEQKIEKGYTEYDFRGFRSSITSFVILKEENLRKNMCVLVHFNNSQSPGVKVYFDIDTSFREPMYLVYQSYKPLGIDSEHNLYGEDLIEYMEEILLRKNKSGSFKFKITKINIMMYNEISRFYIDSLGIVWNHEECADCHIKKSIGLELSSRCNTLINNKCSDNFTNAPKVISQSLTKPLPKVIPKPLLKVIPQVIPPSKQQTNKIKKSSKIETDQRGVNSMIMACKEVLPKNPQSTVEVYINDISTPEFKITYTSTSDTQTHANGTYKIVNSRDSQINSLRFEPFKQYIHTIFDKNSKKQYTVSKINLSLPDGSHKRFYIESLGIVWNADECTDCVLQQRNGEDLSDTCKKLLQDKCQDKFKYRKLD